MNRLRSLLFPTLLILSCCVVYSWQHVLTSLTYLPGNGIVPLALLTPSLLIAAFFTTFTLLKQSKTPRPIALSIVSTGAMLLPILVAGIIYLNYAAHRYAGILPVLFIFPDIPIDIAAQIITALCIAHLTALLICRFVKEKTKPALLILSVIGWILFNFVLFLIAF